LEKRKKGGKDDRENFRKADEEKPRLPRERADKKLEGEGGRKHLICLRGLYWFRGSRKGAALKAFLLQLRGAAGSSESERREGC